MMVLRGWLEGRRGAAARAGAGSSGRGRRGAHGGAAACRCAGAGGRERVGRRARSGQPRRPLPGDGTRGNAGPCVLPRPGQCNAWRNSAETRELSPTATEPVVPAADLDAGQPVIEQAGAPCGNGGGPPRRLRRRPGGAAPHRRQRGARRRSQDAHYPHRPAPRPGGQGSQPAPVPRLQLPPPRRPSRRALGRGRADATGKLCADFTTTRCMKRAFRC